MNNQEVSTAYVGSTEIKEARLGTQLVLAPGGDALWYKANEIPTLDLRFADNKSLVDATTGNNLVTFSRASDATYVDSQGVIRNATTNLLVRSEEFDDGAWQKSLVSVSPNAVASPSGLLTADKIVEDTSNGGHYIFRGTAVTAGAAYTVSFYVKAAERSRVAIRFFSTNSAFSTSDAFFDLSGGTVVAGATVDSASIVSVGDGWYRVIASEVATASATGNVGVYLVSSGTNLVYTGDGTSGLYLWGAQLEQSSTVGEYIPTTSTINSAPRFDHNPSTGESLGLLVEEARTNYHAYSEEADNANSFSGKTNCSVTPNTVSAPNGTTTADTVTVSATGSSDLRVSRLAPTGATTNTWSAYLKAGTNRYATLVLRDKDTAANAVSAEFDLIDGVVSVAPVNGGSATGATATIQALADGWYRCSIAGLVGGTGGVSTIIGQRTVSGVNSADAGTYIYTWGAQLEAGAFPTSYVKTEAATATRAADVASITGTNFSSWYRQYEGTVFASFVPSTTLSATLRSVLYVDSTIPLYILQNASTMRTFDGTNITATSAGISAATVQSVAMTYGGSSVGLSLGGNAAVSGAFDGSYGTTSAYIGASHVSSNYLNGHLSRLTFWPQRLSNAVLQSITQ